MTTFDICLCYGDYMVIIHTYVLIYCKSTSQCYFVAKKKSILQNGVTTLKFGWNRLIRRIQHYSDVVTVQHLQTDIEITSIHD